MNHHRHKQDDNLLAHLGQFCKPSPEEDGWFPPITVKQSTSGFLIRQEEFVVKIQWDMAVDEHSRQMRMFDPTTGEFLTFDWERTLRPAVIAAGRICSTTKTQEHYICGDTRYTSLAEAAWAFLKLRGGVSPNG